MFRSSGARERRHRVVSRSTRNPCREMSAPRSSPDRQERFRVGMAVQRHRHAWRNGTAHDEVCSPRPGPSQIESWARAPRGVPSVLNQRDDRNAPEHRAQEWLARFSSFHPRSPQNGSMGVARQAHRRRSHEVRKVTTDLRSSRAPPKYRRYERERSATGRRDQRRSYPHVGDLRGRSRHLLAHFLIFASEGSISN